MDTRLKVVAVIVHTVTSLYFMSMIIQIAEPLRINLIDIMYTNVQYSCLWPMRRILQADVIKMDQNIHPELQYVETTLNIVSFK